MQILKVDWRDGFCSLIVDRDNILVQSMQQINKLDLNKELKINFKGEISNDARGLIREWFTVIFKEIQKSELSNINLLRFKCSSKKPIQMSLVIKYIKISKRKILIYKFSTLSEK